MIIQCANCSKKLKVPDSSAGKKAKCPGCGTVIPIKPIDEVNPQDQGPSDRLRRPKESQPIRKKKKRSTSERPAERKQIRSSSAQPPAERPRPAKKKRPAKKRKRKPEPDPYDDPFDNDPYDDDAFEDEFGGASAYGDDYDDFGDDPYSAPQSQSGGSRKRSPGGGGLNTVGTGLQLMAWSMIAMFVMGVLVFLTALTGVEILVGLAALGMVAVFVIGGITILVGEGMCVTAPAESGAKPLIIGAIACQVLQFFINVAGQAQFRGQQGPSLAMAIIGIVVGLGFFVLFLLFLRTIAKYARKDKHVRQATILLVGLPTIWVLGGATIYFATQNGAPGIAVLIILGILGIASLVFGIMYIALLLRLGSDIKSGSSASTSKSKKGTRSSGRSRKTGDRHVVFTYTISIVVMTFQMNSAVHHIRKGESAFAKGLPYTLISLFFGWWGIPWGPIYTITDIVNNSNGGKDAQ